MMDYDFHPMMDPTECYVWDRRYLLPILATWLLLLSPLRCWSEQMEYPGADWFRTTPEAVLVDSAKLQVAVDYLANRAPPGGQGVSELAILRNGRVIWEGPNVGNPRHTFSVTKSFATTMLGLLIDDGIVTLDTLAKNYVPALAADYPDVTLRHLATHTSGYLALGQPVPILDPAPLDDPFTPDSPLFTPPGSYYAYSNTGMDQLMNILTRVAEEPMQEFCQRRIGDAIGLLHGSWDWGEYVAGDGLVVDGGGGFTDRGVNISALDLARFGHLFMNDGSWDGEQLISSEWVNAATSTQVPASIPIHPGSATGGPGGYGYGWWTDRTRYLAIGYDVSILEMYPSEDLIIVRLGGDFPGVMEYWWDFSQLVRSALQREIVWDEAGDGEWCEIDPITNESRWLGPNGNRLQLYPHSEWSLATIRSDRVLVESYQSVRDLVVEGGALAIAASGRIEASRNYLQSTTGTLELVDPCSSNGLTVLTIAQRAILSGPIAIEANGSPPNLGDELVLIDTGTGVTGRFRAVAGISASPDISWAVLYEPKRVVLRATLSADFNLDNDVDGNDFLVWQAHFGGSEDAVWVEGDADGDGDVDGSDFLIWQQRQGDARSIPVSVPVPEPAALCLALIAAPLICFRCARCSLFR